ncbi:XRE family transcriptional regulator [Gracilimonas sp. Q87]|uniref:XRE family transcriptional regulator n=1 Tax=Gracilimonas sp. Q87 TaxID=3384766 RepID=UPI0039843176
MLELQYLTQSISNKLKLLEEVLDLDPSEMAKICGCSLASYYRYRAGKSVPGWDFLVQIINYDKRVNPNWLLKDSGPVLNNAAFPSTDSTIKLPFYKMYEDNISGEGSLSISDWRSSKEEITICLDIFKFVNIESFDNLIVIKVQCDAMYPDIKPGSITIIDREQKNINLDGIYLIKFTDVIRMKMVQKAPNNKIQLSTINSKYKPMLIPLEELEDNIIGKIIWVGTPYN